MKKVTTLLLALLPRYAVLSLPYQARRSLHRHGANNTSTNALLMDARLTSEKGVCAA